MVEHQKLRFENQVLELKNKIGVLQSALERRNGSEDMHKQSVDRKHIFSTINLGNDGSLEQLNPNGPASKVKSRTFNSSRQANNSNRNGSSMVISNSQSKTPIAAQLSTAVTSGSQKNLNNTQQHPLLAISKKGNILNASLNHKQSA